MKTAFKITLAWQLLCLGVLMIIAIMKG